MTNPILVEVLRGALVESRHRGTIAVVDAAGKRRFTIGDVGRAVFPRSSVKLIQALPLVESGAADAYGFGAAELALACASHSGEPRHLAIVSAMLQACGRGATDLQCGPQTPFSTAAARDLIRAGEPASALHNTCSGKHAGFICLACHHGVDPTGYVGLDHPVQQEVRSVLEELTGTPLAADVCATDGCSIPTYAIPLDRLAAAFATLATGAGLSAQRATAARRLFDACMAEPTLVAGTGRFCTDAMLAVPGRLLVKTGAEGVYCGAIPELGLGIALKCEDGATRAAETMMAAVVQAILPMSAAERDLFAARLRPAIHSRVGKKVGEIRPVTGLIESIREGRPTI